MNSIAMRDAAPAEALPATHPAAAIAETSAIVQMIERAASNPAVDIDKMERLLEMQERVLNRRSREAYMAAFAQMQPALPEIAERGKGHGNITYALWEDVNAAIKPILSAHGFGLSFRVGRASDKITVTGILSHRDGHSEETTMELPLDQSGSKNAVQAVGSSTSYGKRYVAGALLNLTSRLREDRDDDGAAAGLGETITDEQAIMLRELIEAKEADKAAFLKFFKIDRLGDLPAGKYDQAAGMLRQKGAHR